MNANKPKNTPAETLSRYIEGKGMRRTPERFAILDKAMGMKGQFTAEALVKRLADGDFRVSRASIYNSLQLFEDAGLIRRHQSESQSAVYEKVTDSAAKSNRLHLVCKSCGSVKNVSDPNIARLLAGRHFNGFSQEYSATYVYGLCSKCKKQNQTQ